MNRQWNENRWIGAICAAPVVVLTLMGFLENRHAACHPNFIEQLSSTSSSGERVVVKGRVVTGRGPGSTLVFTVKPTAVLFGERRSAEVTKPMVLA